ncbi:Major facilitator superfamily domain, general substrate transporter [Penicillium digitatum]|uniref:Major facilitator superfamily (MFS) profile domain-containing protein n=3 Tax=Penicillium digitatum TaxID=36651 RepID=K9FUJ1_PEND2|nr:hypothetical protein PDIP_17260 [Penicillium digitatum Pd1]EKV12207.1 hypothetical protein PDIG_45320 [Penicillium digitatum PHI26]EKV20367.1 hypothetical protein PDIP_17260 [Penicillium digitatum Pd1]QQK45325.1 Major facilitator superfamily domain, general substrate transporter [Penicillium digitatum]
MASLKYVEAPTNKHKEDKGAIAFKMDDVVDQKPQDERSEATMDVELQQFGEQLSGLANSRFVMNLFNPIRFTYVLVAFTSMGGVLSGIDQSLINGANLYLPIDPGLSSADNSLVNAGIPLGAIAGALILSPAKDYLGRRMTL